MRGRGRRTSRSPPASSRLSSTWRPQVSATGTCARPPPVSTTCGSGAARAWWTSAHVVHVHVVHVVGRGAAAVLHRLPRAIRRGQDPLLVDDVLHAQLGPVV